jgi:hypothetical protein
MIVDVDLPVFTQQFKMSLGMITRRAEIGRFATLMEESAIAASPNHRFFPFENATGIDIGCQVQIPFFMLFFCNRYGVENNRDIAEALFFGNLSKPGIHFGMLIVFSSGSFF